MTSRRLVQLWFDGATSPGNPGPSGLGIFIKIFENKSTSKKLINTYKGYKFIGHHTNNEAEYSALILGLKVLKNLEKMRVINVSDQLHIQGDSQLVINQITDEWKVNKPELVSYNAEAKKLSKNFENVVFNHVKRNYNEEADFLSKLALKEKNTTTKYLQN